MYLKIIFSLKFFSLFCPFISTYCIVLNLYNGDIIGTQENLEYGLWYLIPLISNLYIDCKNKVNFDEYFLDYNLLIMGILNNIYWYYVDPLANPNDKRHRTEYYDTQCLLCMISYYTMVERFKMIKKQINNRVEPV